MKNKKSHQENWEEEFYKRFESEINGLGSVWEIHKIKSFISQLLSQQKQDVHISL